MSSHTYTIFIKSHAKNSTTLKGGIVKLYTGRSMLNTSYSASRITCGGSRRRCNRNPPPKFDRLCFQNTSMREHLKAKSFPHQAYIRDVALRALDVRAAPPPPPPHENPGSSPEYTLPSILDYSSKNSGLLVIYRSVHNGSLEAVAYIWAFTFSGLGGGGEG